MGPKAKPNLKKHGVSFEEAATSLYDLMALVQEDIDSMGANHWIFSNYSAKERAWNNFDTLTCLIAPD